MTIKFGPVFFSGPGHYGQGEFLEGSLPVAGSIIDKFGSMESLLFPDGHLEERTSSHNGVDISASRGTQVLAPAPGLVLRAGFVPKAGYHIAIRHEGGTQTHYYHLEHAPTLEVGASVERGDVIGIVGSSGWASGPHLHWGVFIPNEGFVDPLLYIATSGELIEPDPDPPVDTC